MDQVADEMLIRTGFSAADFAGTVQEFAEETGRLSRALFYRDVLDDFQEYEEGGAPLYTSRQLGGVLRNYADDPVQTVTVRCYPPEADTSTPRGKDLPPHTSFTYVPEEEKIEINTMDEPEKELEDICQQYLETDLLQP